MRSNIYLNILILGLTFLTLSSCQNNFVSADSKEINGDWAIEQVVELSLELSDTKKKYNLIIDVDVKDDFLTNNLWLFISTKSPSGNVESDKLMFYVTDEKGKWFGNKSDDIIKNKFLYKSNIKFPEAGTYLFQITHGMRENDLPKVVSVGVSIEECGIPTKNDTNF